MCSDIAIKLDNISKNYEIYEKPRDRLKQAFWGGRRQFFKSFNALKGVSFEVGCGEAIGIIGRNGCGKSTLLQIIADTLSPTGGEVLVNGRVAALLELGSGFNPEFTGKENVYLNAKILGLSNTQIEQRYDQIVEFAEIGEFIDQPIKMYSSGMFVRLAFSVVINVSPDILIVDEALSVGDFFFQQKCLDRIRKMQSEGMTLLFVSHDMGVVRDICQKTIYLRKGVVEYFGDTQKAIKQYLSHGGDNQPRDEQPGLVQDIVSTNEIDEVVRNSVWSSAIESRDSASSHLIAVSFYDLNDVPAIAFRMGETMRISVAYFAAHALSTHVSVEIRNKYNQTVTSLGSSRLGLEPPRHTEGQAVIFDLAIDLHLEAGEYSVQVNLGNLVSANQGRNLDASPLLGPVSIKWDYEKETAPFLGMVGLPARGYFKIQKENMDVKP